MGYWTEDPIARFENKKDELVGIMTNNFRKWWFESDGSVEWTAALDAEGGTLYAIEMVFNKGRKAGTEFKAIKMLQENSYDHHTPCMICIPTEKWKEAMELLDDNFGF